MKIAPFSVAVFLVLLAGAGAYSPKSHRFGSKPTPSSDDALPPKVSVTNAASPRSSATFIAFQPLGFEVSSSSDVSSKSSYRFGHKGMPSADDVLPRQDTAMSAAKDPNGAKAEAPARPFPDKDMANIYAQNQAWKQQKLDEDEDFFKKLGATHKPDYMWIGCSDARVPANEIMGEDAGSVFVMRNVANLVVSTDVNLMAGLQFAVNVLKVPHIIVCGHYDCGGVRASMLSKDHVPPLEDWLRNIRDVYRLHRLELNAIEDPEQRHCRLVELNIIEQCINLFKTGAVQRRRLDTYKEGAEEYTSPQIHACVFDPKIGDLKRLTIDSQDFIDDLHPIYGLYTLGDEHVIEEKPHALYPGATTVATDFFEDKPQH